MPRTCLIILCSLVYLSPAWGQSAEQKKATIAYVGGLQTADGGFLESQPKAGGEPQPGSLRATTEALRALEHWGGEPKDRAACRKFVQSCFHKDSGGFSDRPDGKPDVMTTAVGIMAVVELKMPTDPYSSGVAQYLGEHARTFEEIRIAAAGLEAIGKRPSQADAWLAQIARMQNPDGTYGKGDGMARATGSVVAAVLRLGGKVEHPEAAINAMKHGQRADGGFGLEGVKGSDLGTSYRVLRSLRMLKQKPADVAACRAFVARCRNDDGGYGVAPGQASSASGTYFATTILNWLEDK